MKREVKSVKVPIWRSMQMKFAVSYILLIVAALLLLNTYPIYGSQESVFKAKQNSLQNQAALISSTLSTLETLTPEGVEQVMQMLDEQGMTRILVTDADSLILYDTAGEAVIGIQYALLQEIRSALAGKDVFLSSYRDGVFRSSSATPIMYRNATIGAVYLYEYDSEQGVIITGLQYNLVRISLFIMAIAFLISVFLSRTMLRRISRLVTGISDLQAGEYTTRIDVSGRDEMATLANAFNDLTERLETTDEVRKRFVSDASHELKTPLSSIKLLTDSIVQNQDMDMETVREFVQDIGAEADRLTRITEKLLALTRLDNGAVRERVCVDLMDVMTDALHMLTPLAAQRDIRIHLQAADVCTVRSTADEMHQVFFNLVENAIKYNVDGGDVWIRMDREEDKVTVAVSDSGVGIPEEERDKIFDRFYRVDKARSREAGGTGLGLSIVRDTIILNGGTISVSARPEGGSQFSVELPVFDEKKEAQV